MEKRTNDRHDINDRRHGKHDICETCEGRGYLEVIRDDSREYIEACQNCNYDGEDLDEEARVKASENGYELAENGLILRSFLWT